MPIGSTYRFVFEEVKGPPVDGIQLAQLIQDVLNHQTRANNGDQPGFIQGAGVFSLF